MPWSCGRNARIVEAVLAVLVALRALGPWSARRGGLRLRRRFRARPDATAVALIDRGYFEPQDRDDREALAAAVNACFSDALMTL